MGDSMCGDHLFETAVRFHQEGRLEQAETLYRAQIEHNADHSDAVHLLGVVRYQRRDHRTAVELIGRAIELSATNAAYFNNYGMALHALGRFDEALQSFRRALEISPRYAQAMANLGLVQESLGQYDAALASYREALGLEAFHPDATIKLAVLLEKLGRADEAIRVYENGIAHAPCLEFYVNLGALWISAERPDRALRALKKAVELAPGCIAAHVNLAGAYAKLAREADALASYRKAQALQPDNEETLKRMAAFVGELGRMNEATSLYRQLVAVRPSADHWVKFGHFLMSASRTPEAAEAYRQAIALDERDGRAHFSLAGAHQELLDASSAQRHFARAAELRPDKPLWQLHAEVCGPAVFENTEEIEEYCRRVEEAVKKRNAHTPSPPSPPAPLPEGEGSINDVLEAGAFPSFGLSYLGGNQRRLKEQFAGLYEGCFRERTDAAVRDGLGPGPLPAERRGGRSLQRIGFLVTRRHEGIFARCMSGLLRHLDPERFEPVVLAPRASIDVL